MTTRRVAIVGAGIGGLATAMRLAARGGSPSPCWRRTRRSGGRANVREERGYRFDTGPSLLLMTDVYRELFAACGEDFDSLVPLIKMEPNYRVHFGDGSTLEMSSDLTTMVANLEKIEPGVAPGYYRFLEDASHKYRIGRKQFVEKNFAQGDGLLYGSSNFGAAQQTARAQGDVRARLAVLPGRPAAAGVLDAVHVPGHLAVRGPGGLYAAAVHGTGRGRAVLPARAAFTPCRRRWRRSRGNSAWTFRRIAT